MQIASAASCHDVLPDVLTTPGPRNNVIDRLGRPPAVLAPVTIPGEDGIAGKRDGPSVGHPHELIEPDHGRDRQLDPFGSPYSVRRLQHLGFVVEDQDGGAPRTHHG